MSGYRRDLHTRTSHLLGVSASRRLTWRLGPVSPNVLESLFKQCRASRTNSQRFVDGILLLEPLIEHEVRNQRRAHAVAAGAMDQDALAAAELPHGAQRGLERGVADVALAEGDVHVLEPRRAHRVGRPVGPRLHRLAGGWHPLASPALP